jgi:hypothetical protein
LSLNPVLDIAIGLVLMYLLLALTCTALNEVVAQILQWRAQTLRRSLLQLIDDKTLRADFYDHGLVAGLMGAKQDAAGGRHPSYLSGETFSRALLGSLDVTKTLPGFKDVEEAVKNLPDSNIRDTLLAHVTTAEGSFEKLQGDLATWFDHAMDRLSGIYTRKLRALSLALGVSLAVAMNADSVSVAQRLWEDGALRQDVAQAAAQFVNQHPAGIGTAGNTGVSSGLTGSITTDAAAKLQQSQASLRAFPIGWPAPDPDWYCHPKQWLAKIAGLLLTGLAVSLGAPFWFDMLSKFVQIRATGDKPQRSKGDES